MLQHPKLPEKNTQVCLLSGDPQADRLIAYYVLDRERTSLKPYVEMLEKHALGLMSVVRRDRIANGECAVCQNWPGIYFLDRYDMVTRV
jgi:hypothetical protein